MKKLMMVFAVVAMAMAAQANAVKWGASLVSPSTGTTGSTGYAGYLFLAGGASTVYTVAGITSALAGGNTKVLENAFSSAGASSVVSTGTNAGKMTWTTQTAAGTIADGNTVDAFLVIVDDTQSHFLVAQYGGKDILSKTVAAGASTAYNFTFGSQASNANTWQTIAVPEPTSGLLMLLGVAGLALRRRRA